MYEAEYQGNISLHEGSHAACCILMEIPFLGLTAIPGRMEGSLKKYGGCLTYRNEPTQRWYAHQDDFIAYPKDEEAVPPVGARTVLLPLTEEERRWSIRHCIVSFAGAVIEELDPYNETGKHTPWGPTQDFIDVEMRIEFMGWLNKSKADQKQQFDDIFEHTRKLFKDENGVTPLWKRSVEIGKVLYRVKKLSEGQCRKIYNDYQEPPRDHRYPEPEPWPLLRKNI